MQYANRVLHYTTFSLILLYYFVATIISICTLLFLKRSNKKKSRNLAIYVVLSIIITYLEEVFMLVFDTLNNQLRKSTIDNNVSIHARQLSKLTT